MSRNFQIDPHDSNKKSFIDINFLVRKHNICAFCCAIYIWNSHWIHCLVWQLIKATTINFYLIFFLPHREQLAVISRGLTSRRCVFEYEWHFLRCHSSTIFLFLIIVIPPFSPYIFSFDEYNWRTSDKSHFVLGNQSERDRRIVDRLSSPFFRPQTPLALLHKYFSLSSRLEFSSIVHFIPYFVPIVILIKKIHRRRDGKRRRRAKIPVSFRVGWLKGLLLNEFDFSTRRDISGQYKYIYVLNKNLRMSYNYPINHM